MGSLVEVEVDGRVGIITLNGPPVNALSVALVDELRAAQAELVTAGVFVGVVRSAVPKFFVAGADLKLLGT
ncbi:MAG: enoyl-CoA hydratase-related protein, partial [Gaiellaceae bacterium]